MSVQTLVWIFSEVQEDQAEHFQFGSQIPFSFCLSKFKKLESQIIKTINAIPIRAISRGLFMIIF